MQGSARFAASLRWVMGSALGVLLVPAVALAQGVTYAKDVAPIIQQNCQTCHRPGSAAPFALMTYEDARQWAPLIRQKVTTRKMPPWPVDTQVGIQRFKNDRSLSDDEIATIAQWVDGGTPMGNPADLPEPIAWPAWSDRWTYTENFGRPPDVIFSSPPYTVVADGMDQWPQSGMEITREMGIVGERWVRAVEIRPANPESRYVFHHANARVRNRTTDDVSKTQVVRQRDASQSSQRDYLANSAIGTEGEIYPEGTGRLIKEGDLVGFDLHFYPIEHDVTASLQVGLWLYPEGEVPYPTEGWLQFGMDGLAGMDDNILIVPPHSQVMYRGTTQLDGNAKVFGLRGHMHMRGKYQILEAIYPDGRYELLNKLNWDHGWHTQFLYEEDAQPLLPKGTTLILTSVFDNTSANPSNPDPDQWIVEGARTADEMHNLRIGVTFLNEEEFQRAVAERERVVASSK